ncbi:MULTISPECIES: hypothetical protein [Pseudoxanthomonas]|jgi:hypothetical protein|uniref:Membrane channel-forming protein YqfA (Hemolysin III family) n=1 Tax=Pseudoxanthomonas winnipegensis TaxID=2480810 RepID=A0AAW8GD83_9GAMM|nr:MULTISPECIES: hypothetical protein [Pseudoxanthomonas]MDQ1119696.1 putative membrane channel-forming protein YqfA (hemolysin III family) [Pseudoxanthomonas winnipegensis]MDQ1132894.1 putative membrane channel-forming protein YqfA (hemolysin III family) [Pseudoxanthomonas winnipegensis]MDR6137102.1 putative membrane channel-forming protein YqfA (hemolysin III family) [Pseudoxanthomonas sp. SORGH_AS_0997]UAY73613.1 hypothetical protein LAJ50_14070 [Pseudoxanthomonas sp. X-1]WJI16909.1 hypothe
MFNLSPPTSGMFFLSLLLGGLGVAAKLHYIPALVPYAFWLVCAGLVVLLIGNLFKGL